MLQMNPDVIVLLLYFEGISRLMIMDLEAEKAVDSSKCLGTMSGYSQLCTAVGIFGLICGLAFNRFMASAADRAWSRRIFRLFLPSERDGGPALVHLSARMDR